MKQDTIDYNFEDVQLHMSIDTEVAQALFELDNFTEILYTLRERSLLGVIF